jgi:hypothetical protein
LCICQASYCSIEKGCRGDLDIREEIHEENQFSSFLQKKVDDVDARLLKTIKDSQSVEDMLSEIFKRNAEAKMIIDKMEDKTIDMRILMDEMREDFEEWKKEEEVKRKAKQLFEKLEILLFGVRDRSQRLLNSVIDACDCGPRLHLYWTRKTDALLSEMTTTRFIEWMREPDRDLTTDSKTFIYNFMTRLHEMVTEMISQSNMEASDKQALIELMILSFSQQ